MSALHTDKLHLPLAGWLCHFFEYSLKKKKNFYWAWKSFMIVVRKQKDKIMLVLEIPLQKAPFLAQKHIDITNIPNDVIVKSLLFLYYTYDSSPMLRRNMEHSTRFLSFISFIQMLANHDIKKPTDQLCATSTQINQLLVAYIMKTLDLYNVNISINSKKQTPIYSLSQLLNLQRSKALRSNKKKQ